jgi:predicted nucleic acid-binding protein
VALSDESDGPWLIDKSALARLSRSPEADLWLERIERGLVRIGTVTLLEVGFSARSAADLRPGADRALIDAMPVEYLTPRSEDRAVEVQALLADRGQHRAAAIPDLLIAAVAELGGLRVLHHDHDFELIADATGQPVEMLRSRQ